VLYKPPSDASIVQPFTSKRECETLRYKRI
jgi:hypothetical protein